MRFPTRLFPSAQLLLLPPPPTLMPHPNYDSPPLAHSKQPFSSPETHSSPRSWKSVFRFPNSSNRKLSIPPSPLLVEEHPLPSFPSHSTLPIPSLAPTSYRSETRSSYNSSNTQSTDSNTPSNRLPFATTQTHYPPRYVQQQQSSEHLSTAVPWARKHTKSERARPNFLRLQQPPTPSPRPPPQLLTPDPNDATFQEFAPPATPQRSRTNHPMSPKSVTASASRFIRRVASAPNAKGLFAMGSRSSTKNGLLSPGDDGVPPLPQLISSSSDQGQDSSLETVSSAASSRARSTRPIHPPSSAPLNSIAVQNGLLPVPDKIAFKRTYSSNSIKVRQVSIPLHADTMLLHHFASAIYI